MISALPLLTRGVENSGDGRLSLLDFLGVLWWPRSFDLRVVGAGCEDAKKSSGSRDLGTVLRVISGGSCVEGSLKPDTIGNSLSDSGSLRASLSGCGTGGREAALVTCICRMRALAGMSLTLPAFVFLGALGLGAWMFAVPVVAVAFRFAFTVSLGFRSEPS
jgi:hypothetical protein